MKILIFFICLGVLGWALAILFAVLVRSTRRNAKKEAREILQLGHIDNPEKMRITMSVLSSTKNDLEAADLWQRLSKLQRG